MKKSKLREIVEQDRLRQMAEAQLRRQQEAEQQSFKQISASELYCPKCKRSMPVREKMLLYIPTGEIHDYLCQQCGTSLGTRTDG